MDRKEFLNYIDENFNISWEALLLIDNILKYAEQRFKGNDQYLFLCDMLNDTIGLWDSEIKMVHL